MTGVSTLFIQARPWRLSLATILAISLVGAVLSGRSVSGWVDVETRNATMLPAALQLFPACAVTWMLWSPMSDVEHTGPCRVVAYRTGLIAAMFSFSVLGTLPLLTDSVELWLLACRALLLYVGLALVGAHFASGNLCWLVPVVHFLLVVVASHGYETTYSWSVVNMPVSDILSWLWACASMLLGLAVSYLRRYYCPPANTR